MACARQGASGFLISNHIKATDSLLPPAAKRDLQQTSAKGYWRGVNQCKLTVVIYIVVSGQKYPNTHLGISILICCKYVTKTKIQNGRQFPCNHALPPIVQLYNHAWPYSGLGKPHCKSCRVYSGIAQMGGGSRPLPGWFGALILRRIVHVQRGICLVWGV